MPHRSRKRAAPPVAPEAKARTTRFLTGMLYSLESDLEELQSLWVDAEATSPHRRAILEHGEALRRAILAAQSRLAPGTATKNQADAGKASAAPTQGASSPLKQELLDEQAVSVPLSLLGLSLLASEQLAQAPLHVRTIAEGYRNKGGAIGFREDTGWYVLTKQQGRPQVRWMQNGRKVRIELD